MLKRMLKGIYFQSIVIGFVIRQIWQDSIFTRSLAPVVRLLDPRGRYEIGDEIRKGNYYSFVRDMINHGYYPMRRGE